MEGKWVTAEPDQGTATKITPRREKKKKKKKQFGLYVEQIVCVLNIPVRFISTS